MTDAARQAIEAGTVLAGSYELTRMVGRGGMGAVWEARHLRLEGKRVAIKVLHAEVAGDADSVARFRREAQIASRLGHPNIVQVNDFNELSDGTQYLVLEFLEGESLSDRLARGPLPVDQALAIVRQVGAALLAAHRENIIHRDLKPHNVFLCPTETGGYATEQAKVLDFGISKIRGSQTVQTQTSMMLGTPQYMAPEQALGDHAAVDARTDVFALGAMTYEMLVGRPAFQGTSIPEVVFKVVYEEPPNLGAQVPSLPPGLVAAVHRAMAKKQADRFPDVSSFVEALTGAPLTTLRGGQVTPMSAGALAGQTGRSHGVEAFAATMAPGSVALASTQAAGLASTQAAGLAGTQAAGLASTQAAGVAGTYGPAGGAYGAPGMPAYTPAPAPGMPAYTPAPAPGMMAETHKVSRRSPALLLGALAAIVAVAVAVTVVVMRGPGPQENSAPVPAAVASGHAPVVPEPPPEPPSELPGEPMAAVVAAQRENAAAAAAAARRLSAEAGERTTTELERAAADLERAAADIDTLLGDTSNEPKRQRPRGDSDDAPKSGPVAEKLALARKHLSSGQPERAIQEARSSLGIQRTTLAYAIITEAYCATRDLSNARANIKHVKTRRERVRLARLCAAQGVTLD